MNDSVSSWIDRNLPETADRDCTVAAAEPDFVAEAAERARVWNAVNALPPGVVTDADLEQVGITRYEFARVSREAAARVFAEEQAQAEAERDRASGVEPRLADRVAECGRAVEDVENAARHHDRVDEDTERAERCARWNTDDAADEQVANDTEEWGQ